jgi:hypothetical protein
MPLIRHPRVEFDAKARRDEGLEEISRISPNFCATTERVFLLGALGSLAFLARDSCQENKIREDICEGSGSPARPGKILRSTSR